MATVSEQIQEIYIGLLGRAADKEGLEYWTAQVEAGNITVDQVRANVVDSQDEYATGLGAMSREDAVTELYARMFERAPEAEGLEYWVNGEGKNVDVDELVMAMSAGASEDDTAVLVNKSAAAEYYTANAAAFSAETAAAAVADVDATAESLEASKAATDAIVAPEPEPEPEPEPVDGEIFDLTSSTDKGADFTGTADNDFFDAGLVQNEWAGGVSNSLSSADELDGGAGTDTLSVELVPEFFGVTGDNRVDVQPETKNIEIVELEVQDGNANETLTVTVDAKDMTDIDKIGSKQSDGDLIIENLTTLESNDNVRNTETITITMDHTDNFNSDGDASDLTVYFDEDYLKNDSRNTGSSLTINMINTLNNKLAEDGGTRSLIEGFKTLSFTVGETVVSVDVDGLELSDVKGAIENALTEAGITTVSVETYLEPAFFATNIYYEDTGTTYDAGTRAGDDYTAFRLTNTGSEELVEGSFTLADGARDGSLAYSQDDSESSRVEDPVTVQVELHKVGRHGEGGNLVIGGKSYDGLEGEGIEVFNVTVLGGTEKPSNLGQITSTNGDLETINVVSEAGRTDGDYASLTIRGESSNSASNTTPNDATPFGSNLGEFNAASFYGDLTLGNETRVDNLGTLVATGGGAVEFWGDNTTEITTGAAADYINEVNTGAEINTGAGNDTIIVDADVDGVSINAGSGNDTVDLLTEELAVTAHAAGNGALIDGEHGFDAVADQVAVTVDLGAGDDFLSDNNDNVTVDSGSGDDVMYLENTGAKGAGALALDMTNEVGDEDNMQGEVGNNTGVIDTGYNLLFGRTLTVTFNGDQGVNNSNADAYTDGFEATTTIASESLDGYSYLTDVNDLHAAIERAIEESPVLSALISYENGVFTSLVDGSDNTVEVVIADADWSVQEQEQILSEYRDYYDDSDADLGTTAERIDVVALAGGTDSTDSSDNTVVIAQGNDVVQLSTSFTSMDTLEFTTNDFGVTYVNNFDGNDRLDFSAYLLDAESDSTSALSVELIDRTFGTDATLEANELTLVTFNATAEVADWDDLTAENIMDFTDFQAAFDESVYGGVAHSVVMVENDENEGEYKVFYVEFDSNDANEELNSSNFDQKGIVDFGATLDINGVIAGEFASSALGNTSTEDGSVVTYDLDASVTAVNEGSSVTFTLTTNAADGDYNYSIGGDVNAADIVDGATSGTMTVTNGVATLTVGLTADVTTEGLETLSLTVAGESVSVTVNDTSAAAASGNDIPVGQEASFNVGTAGVADLVTFDVASAKALGEVAGVNVNSQVDVIGFEAGVDTLQLDLADGVTGTTLADLAGQADIIVQSNPFETEINVSFGADANGDLVTLALAGITDPSLVDIAII